MKLRSRDHEDPEINVISLIDVVLLLRRVLHAVEPSSWTRRA